VLRRLLLAVLFCLSAWTVADRMPSDRGAHSDTAGVTASAAPALATNIGATVATPPIDTHPPEARWEALLPQGIGGGSSRTDQSQPQAQAADLPGVSSRVPWPAIHRTDAERHAVRFRSAHLLHTPLLI
jgi:hypothetical protein